jgi:putative intracellular protease/amidase
MKVLIVRASHDRLGGTGRQAGFRLEEPAAPHRAFKAAGAEIVTASPKAGQPPPNGARGGPGLADRMPKSHSRASAAGSPDSASPGRDAARAVPARWWSVRRETHDNPGMAEPSRNDASVFPCRRPARGSA